MANPNGQDFCTCSALHSFPASERVQTLPYLSYFHWFSWDACFQCNHHHNPASPKYDNVGKNVAPSNVEVLSYLWLRGCMACDICHTYLCCPETLSIAHGAPWGAAELPRLPGLLCRSQDSWRSLHHNVPLMICCVSAVVLDVGRAPMDSALRELAEALLGREP